MSHVKLFDVWWHHHEYDQEQGIGMPRGRSWYLFYKDWEQHNLYVQGFTSRLYCKKGIQKSLDVVCPHLNVERIKTRKYLSNILECDTSSDDIQENIYHWLD